MASDRAGVLEALDAVIGASREAREGLRLSEASYARFRRRIEKGLPVAEAFAGLEVPGLRRDITERLHNWEHARLGARRAIIALGVSQGLSFGALGRMWGFSRQLVTRIAKESEERRD